MVLGHPGAPIPPRFGMLGEVPRIGQCGGSIAPSVISERSSTESGVMRVPKAVRSVYGRYPEKASDAEVWGSSWIARLHAWRLIHGPRTRACIRSGMVTCMKNHSQIPSLEKSCGAGHGDMPGARESPQSSLGLSFLHRRAILCVNVTMPTALLPVLGTYAATCCRQ